MGAGPEIRFYHLQTRSLEQTLPILLQRCLDRKMRAVVRTGDDQAAERLNDHLWSFSQRSFLPHGSEHDGHAGLQPIWLTSKSENPNGAKVLFVVSDDQDIDMSGYDLVCHLFDGRSDGAVSAARARWKTLLSGGHHLTYWQQDSGGRWDKKHQSGGED